MFHNKCTSCGATHSKSKFGWIRERGKFVVPKMLEQNEKESTEGGKLGLIYDWLRTCFKKI